MFDSAVAAAKETWKAKWFFFLLLLSLPLVLWLNFQRTSQCYLRAPLLISIFFFPSVLVWAQRSHMCRNVLMNPTSFLLTSRGSRGRLCGCFGVIYLRIPVFCLRFQTRGCFTYRSFIFLICLSQFYIARANCDLLATVHYLFANYGVATIVSQWGKTWESTSKFKKISVLFIALKFNQIQRRTIKTQHRLLR